jgi:hypothetical protein
VNWSAEPVALVPPELVTVTSTVPLPAGAVAVIDVALLTVNEVAAVAPNFTAVAPVNDVPVMVTDVPPAPGPLFGAIEITDGGRTWAWASRLAPTTDAASATTTKQAARMVQTRLWTASSRPRLKPQLPTSLAACCSHSVLRYPSLVCQV